MGYIPAKCHKDENTCTIIYGVENRDTLSMSTG